MRRRALALALLGIAGGARGEELRNWFGDPFFQVRTAVSSCPTPRGPLMTEDEMRRSAHARAERGTRCWQEGACAKPNAYMYDAGIADAVRQRFEASGELKKASLWVTVQRRIVWIEGCAADSPADARIRRLLHDVPDVEQVIVTVYRGGSGRPPYSVVKE